MQQRAPIPDSDDTIKILITTDNHVGYKENDAVVGNDSWKTFDEIMKIAVDHNVDMVLQSGDLFHVNHPSKKSAYEVMRIIRTNCFGDRPCELELLSDPSTNFDDGFNCVNYEDPNLNVAIPIFAISGNHDDSTGNSFLSPLDVVGVSGYINHFGRVVQSSDIAVNPILLQKGTTKLALYGMANVVDERVFRTFKEGHVTFNRPSIQQDSWFNLMALHQNHHAHTETSYLPEGFLPSFLDLVVWGHEHECIPYTVTNYETGFDVLQPGSSVATSLSEKETAQKHVFVMTIRNRDYHVQPVPLTTVRPFVMEDVVLANSGVPKGASSKAAVTRFLASKVEALIAAAAAKQDSENPPLPLIRLRVDYSGDYIVENPRRFSNMFVGRVANPNDVLHFFKKRAASSKSVKLQDVEVEGAVKVQNYVNEFLKETKLTLLSGLGLNAVVGDFVEKNDKSAIERFVAGQVEKAAKELAKVDIGDGVEGLERYLVHVRGGRDQKSKMIVVDSDEGGDNDEMSAKEDDGDINGDNMVVSDDSDGNSRNSGEGFVAKEDNYDNSNSDGDNSEYSAPPKKRKLPVKEARAAPRKNARRAARRKVVEEVEEVGEVEKVEDEPPKAKQKKEPRKREPKNREPKSKNEPSTAKTTKSNNQQSQLSNFLSQFKNQ